MRRRLELFGRSHGLVLYRNECVDERIEFFLALRFRRLDEPALGNEQRKVGRRRVATVVEEALGEVHGRHVLLLREAREGHQELVRGTAGRIGQVEAGIREALGQVVRVQGRELRDAIEPVAAEHQGIGQRTHQNAGVAHERGHVADGTGELVSVLPAIGHGIAIVFAHDQRRRQMRQQTLTHADRARARPAAAMRRGKGLVQIHVEHVEAHIARPYAAEDGVEIGAVVVKQTACAVHELGDLLDLPLEHAARGRVGHHQTGGLRTD